MGENLISQDWTNKEIIGLKIRHLGSGNKTIAICNILQGSW